MYTDVHKLGSRESQKSMQPGFLKTLQFAENSSSGRSCLYYLSHNYVCSFITRKKLMGTIRISLNSWLPYLSRLIY